MVVGCDGSARHVLFLLEPLKIFAGTPFPFCYKSGMLETGTSGMLEPVVFFAATSCNFCWNWCVLFPWIGVGGDFLLEPSSIFAGTSDMFCCYGRNFVLELVFPLLELVPAVNFVGTKMFVLLET
ncbi:hypothetical protein VPH35_104061 [Triticum aestivum]